MEIVDIILYIAIFSMGAMFGSFYTLAVYRIPRSEDIIKTHSYCPKCRHKLGFLDLIPIFSYIFLKGKCRHCKEKIRPRYFILEILSGLTFVCVAYLMNLSVFTINLSIVIECIFMILYFTFLVLIAGMDKESNEVPKTVVGYGIILSIVYIIYLCIMDTTSIYKYGIYLAIYIALLVADMLELKKVAKNSYMDDVFLSVISILIFTGEIIMAQTLIYTSLVILAIVLFRKIRNNKKQSNSIDESKKEGLRKNIPIMYIMCIISFFGIIQSLIYFKIK